MILECILVGGLGLLLGTYALASMKLNVEFDFRPAIGSSQAIRTHEFSSGLRGRGGGNSRYYIYCRDWRPKGMRGSCV